MRHPPPVPPPAPPGLSRRLYEELRARILDGTHAAGAPLPSTRALAAERGLSRGTVSLVYEQLAADGFITTRTGAASRVAPGVARAASALRAPAARGPAGRLSAVARRIAALDIRDAGPTGTREIDFVYGPLAGADFPTLAWMKALRATERQRSARLEYEDPRGHLGLRRALQAHLSHSRGLACSVEQLMIVNGSQQALDLCARLLVDAGDGVVMENPGYRMAQHAFAACGARLLHVDVDEHGLCTDQLAALGPAQLAFVTPTHQFPLGGFLPMARRRALLAWAARRHAWIIEDDYDSEYRYGVRPEATLQSLDTHGRVIHVGTFSKTLSPQLRLGYMVLPDGLVDVFTAARRVADRHAPTGVQAALARLLADGSYQRHVRRMRRLQQARQRALVEALARHLGEGVQVQGAASGLHLVAWFTGLPASAEGALVQAARQQDVRVYPIGPLFDATAPRARRRPAGLVMGYALLDRPTIEEGVQRLAACVARLMPSRAAVRRRRSTPAAQGRELRRKAD
ncbi:MocR-like pyridoxine biosynthesis transcription factor PdxR [Aquincola tertiaricarbonis]|uniref:MocR-like pyridoxine biosynthesis transcription factor PdxR n=1 Tax=Aquincola tertiaricarbonis TaxID=391953 RepID=UPI0006151DFE